MARHRERFERSDVPRSSAFRSIMALLIVGCIAVGGYLFVTQLWSRVKLEDHLSDRGIIQAIGSQAEPEEFEGFHATGADPDLYAVLYFDDLDSMTDLRRVEILSLEPNGRATAVNIRTDSVVQLSEDESLTLAQICARSGAYECIRALSRVTSLECDHGLIVTEEPWSRIVAHRPMNTRVLEILRCDLADDGLVELGARLNALGVSNIAHVEAPAHSEETQAEDGTTSQTGRSLLYRADLGVMLGILAAN